MKSAILMRNQFKYNNYKVVASLAFYKPLKSKAIYMRRASVLELFLCAIAAGHK